MTEILSLDQAIFHWINSGWQNEILDQIVPLLREELFWFPLYVFVLGFILLNFKTKAIAMIMAIFIAVGLADITSSRVVKNSVQRIRPCNDEEVKNDMILRVPCGTGYSFTSSHATNHFAVAAMIVFFLGRVWKWISWIMYLWAVSIAVAQVYVGVHYPIDVIFGGLLGYLIACLVYYFYTKTTIGLANSS